MGTRERLNYQDIPDRAFLPAIKVREIVKATPLSLEEKRSIQRGSPDIKISPIVGKDYFLSRSDVLENFTYLNGKKIKTSGWESKKQYLIFRSDNVAVAVMQVPLDHYVEVNGVTANGKNRSKGDYIVCEYNRNKTIDRSSAKVVSAAVFRKICYVPTNEVIEKHAGSKNKNFRYIASKVQSGISIAQSKLKSNTGKPQVNLRQPAVMNKPNNIGNRQVMPKAPVVRPGNTSEITVVGQIHDAFGKRKGYILQDKSGRTRKASKAELIKLVESGRVTCVEVVNSQSGEKFLRGNGIKLDSLPIDYE